MLRPIISIYFVCASQGISTSFPGTLGTRLKVSKGGLRYGYVIHLKVWKKRVFDLALKRHQGMCVL